MTSKNFDVNESGIFSLETFNFEKSTICLLIVKV